MFLLNTIGICPVQFYKRYGVCPPEDMIVKITTEFRDFYRDSLLKAMDGNLEEHCIWMFDRYTVLERMKLKLRVWMIDAGYFPGTAAWDDNEEGNPARSKMFSTHHYWNPINSQAATYMPEEAV